MAPIRIVLSIRNFFAEGETARAPRFSNKAMLERAVEGVEDEVRVPACADEEAFPVIGEVEGAPGTGCLVVFGEGVEVEGSEGLFVELADVVEEDGLCGGGGDGEDTGGGVEGCEVGRVDVEHSNRVYAVEVPDADGIIERGGDECVAARVHGEAGYGSSVPFEVAQEGVVVGSEVADVIYGV